MEKKIEKKPCKNCIHYQGCVDTFRKAKQDGEVLLIEEDAYFADAGDCDFYADERIYRKQEWISVEERLPEESGDYLVHVRNGSLATIQYSAKHKAFNASDFLDHCDYAISVTHWMPLPEPPKGDNNDS